MGKIWQIIKFEYIRRVSEKQFLFALLSLPLVRFCNLCFYH